jgi:hypothetical protein
VTRHLAQSVIVAALAVGLALVAGSNRRPALVGAAAASLTGVASIFAMGRAAAAGGKLVQRALAVMVVAFLVRIVLVGVGTVLVGRAGENVFAFVTAFFVPYFIFAAIEGAYVHALSRGTGPTA